MARPSKDNPEWKQKSPAKERAEENGQLQLFYEALKGGLSRSSAVAKSGLQISTVYNRLDTDETFRKKVELCEEYRVSVVEDAKRKKIDEWYRPAIEKELETSKFERYWKRIKNEVKVEWYNLKDMSEEELLKLIKGGE